jgi:hypothetical protein
VDAYSATSLFTGFTSGEVISLKVNYVAFSLGFREVLIPQAFTFVLERIHVDYWHIPRCNGLTPAEATCNAF